MTVIDRPWLPPISLEVCAKVGVRRPSTATIRSPGWSPAAAAGVFAPTCATSVLGFCDGAPVRVDGEEEHERDDDVHARARRDRGYALPGRVAPERVRAGALVDIAHCLLGGAPRRRAQLRLLERSAQRGQRRASCLEVAARERVLHGVRDGAERGIFAERGRHERLEVACSRFAHSRNPHVAAERDRPDSVLDPIPLNLHERGREPDVERTRLHPQKARDREVPELVQEDERREAENDDEPGHHSYRRQTRFNKTVRSTLSRIDRPNGK